MHHTALLKVPGCVIRSKQKRSECWRPSLVGVLTSFNNTFNIQIKTLSFQTSTHISWTVVSQKMKGLQSISRRFLSIYSVQSVIVRLLIWGHIVMRKKGQLSSYTRLSVSKSSASAALTHGLNWALSKGHKPLPEMSDFLLAVLNTSLEFVLASYTRTNQSVTCMHKTCIVGCVCEFIPQTYCNGFSWSFCAF